MFLDILITLAVVIGVLVIVVAVQPSEFRISRSAAIPASSALLFEQVDDLRLWGAWSPWERLDPHSKKVFEGPSSGLGASFSWVGEKSGAGKITTIESLPNELIRFRLEFLKPFKATNTAEFIFKPEGNQTVVTWSMTGKNNFIAKAINLIMNFDKMCGGEFEKGLANLKSVTEVKRDTINR